MKKIPCLRDTPLILCCLILILADFGFASEGDRVRMQGLIMELDLQKKVMVVNERVFVWDQNTVIGDEKGSPIKIDKFKKTKWVYIAARKDKKNQQIIIDKIFLLPRYVEKKDRHLFSFME